jgi:hypothetical protein
MHTKQLCEYAQKYIKVLQSIISMNRRNSVRRKKMRTEQEIRQRVRELENKALNNGPYREWENIAMKAAKQALEWVLEDTEKLLTY